MDDTEIVQRLVKVEESDKSAHHRLDEQEKELNELKKTYSIMEKMDYRMENMEKNVDNINKKLDKHDKAIIEESNKESKNKAIKWDKLIDYIFYAVLAYALFKVGLK